MTSQVIHNTTSLDLIQIVGRDNADGEPPPPLIHADPPWLYSGAAPPKNGRATNSDGGDAHYGGMSCGEIVDDLEAAFDVAAKDAYLVVWCTFPIVWEFAAAWFGHLRHTRWEHLTGGAWGKRGAQGIGFHFLGASELLLVFRKGRPKPRARPKSKNLWTTDYPAAYWEEPRTRTHSEKPQAALDDLIRLGSSPGDLVLDLYAGASASLARACALSGRSYAGAEVDEERAAKARRLLAAITDP